MDNIVDIIEKTKKIDCTNINDAIDMLPVGWYKPVAQLSFALYELRAEVFRVYYIKGTLRIVATSSINDLILPVQSMCEGFSKYLSTRCMIVENQYGMRRKDIDGWPCLSLPVYIEYLNLKDVRNEQN